MSHVVVAPVAAFAALALAPLTAQSPLLAPLSEVGPQVRAWESIQRENDPTVDVVRYVRVNTEVVERIEAGEADTSKVLVTAFDNTYTVDIHRIERFHYKHDVFYGVIPGKPHAYFVLSQRRGE